MGNNHRSYRQAVQKSKVGSSNPAPYNARRCEMTSPTWPHVILRMFSGGQRGCWCRLAAMILSLCPLEGGCGY